MDDTAIFHAEGEEAGRGALLAYDGRVSTFGAVGLGAGDFAKVV
jgi:hypothetical protein